MLKLAVKCVCGMGSCTKYGAKVKAGAKVFLISVLGGSKFLNF